MIFNYVRLMLSDESIYFASSSAHLDRLTASASAQISADMRAPRYPCYCRYLLRSRDPKKWHLTAVSIAIKTRRIVTQVSVQNEPEVVGFCIHGHDFRSRIARAVDDEDVKTVEFDVCRLSSQKASIASTSKPPLLYVKIY